MKLTTLSRWMAVIPVWLVSGFATYYFVLFLFSVVRRYRGIGFLTEGQFLNWATWAACFAAGFVSVGLAASLVPARRKAIACVLAATYVMGTAAMIWVWSTRAAASGLALMDAALLTLGGIVMACAAQSEAPALSSPTHEPHP